MVLRLRNGRLARSSGPNILRYSLVHGNAIEKRKDARSL